MEWLAKLTLGLFLSPPPPFFFLSFLCKQHTNIQKLYTNKFKTQNQWIDPKSGIAAALFTQVMPPTDASVTDLLIELERALYQAIAVETEKPKPGVGDVGDGGNMAKL